MSIFSRKTDVERALGLLKKYVAIWEQRRHEFNSISEEKNTDDYLFTGVTVESIQRTASEYDDRITVLTRKIAELRKTDATRLTSMRKGLDSHKSIAYHMMYGAGAALLCAGLGIGIGHLIYTIYFEPKWNSVMAEYHDNSADEG